jgi:hypothetical protein
MTKKKKSYGVLDVKEMWMTVEKMWMTGWWIYLFLHHVVKENNKFFHTFSECFNSFLFIFTTAGHSHFHHCQGNVNDSGKNVNDRQW